MIPDLDQLVSAEILPRREELQAVKSHRHWHRSLTYGELREQLAIALSQVDHHPFTGPSAEPRPFYRVVAWNVQRGMALEGALSHLKSHPLLSRADVVLLTETDRGMARSGNCDVARVLAEALDMHSAFVPCYVNLTKGNRHERQLHGEDTLGLHGNAILSRYPLSQFRVHALANGKDKLAGPEKRLGQQRCLTATVAFPRFPVTVSCIHLDAHSTCRHRERQMGQILEEIGDIQGPVLLGGDWNTSTYNSQHALPAILGFFRRLSMGVDYSIQQHYLHPDRYFERRLFGRLRKAGFSLDACNKLGEPTLEYDVRSRGTNEEVQDWLPSWTLDVVRWALRNTGGLCPFKLDWFAGRQVACLNAASAPGFNGATEPVVVHGLRYQGQPVSDHDPIVVDLVPPRD